MKTNNHFVQNPAELRAKAEQQRQSARGEKNAHHAIGMYHKLIYTFI